MITVTNLTVKYLHRKREITALDNVSFSVAPGEFVCAIGPSGCGKSSLLHTIAGFIKPCSGKIQIDGHDIEGPDTDRGIVFQKFSLFPWKTVLKNIQFGLTMKNIPASERNIKGKYFLDRIGLTDFADSYPNELSTGMQQRVALARAFVNDPKTLLMDEPFASLDAQTRVKMRELLLEIWMKERKTVFFVTHDIEEAIILSDRIIVLSSRPGKIMNEFIIDLPRPRPYEKFLSPEYAELRHKVSLSIFKK